MKFALSGGTVYVKVSRNTFTIKHVEKNREIIVNAEKPSTTTRLLVGQFFIAEKLLKKAIKTLCGTSLIPHSPVIIIHPVQMVEGGLSEVEERIFKELAAGAKAGKTIVWPGNELSNEKVISLAKNA
ncbi:MAG TPA: 1-pyrroline-5-carboxylate dehydrogenase [Gammaproteobacteria bacterium]|nr:1-pyrroline-5-carboxylate dehydrogenase [Gammaproteobacteria bacterium]